MHDFSDPSGRCVSLATRVTGLLRRLAQALLLVVIVCLALSSDSGAQTYTLTETPPRLNDFKLDGTAFEQYVPLVYLNISGVARANCDPLQFLADATLEEHLKKHTFRINLRRDGTTVQTKGPDVPGTVKVFVMSVTFAPMEFKPGTWSIDWTFAANDQHGEKSISLIAPIVATVVKNTPWPNTPNLDPTALYCSRGSSLPATFTNDRCHFRSIPQTGFIWNNSFYRVPAPTTNCAIGIYDGAHCKVMPDPDPHQTGFVSGNKFYTKYDKCTRGVDDGAHCLLGPVPSGLFTWNNAYYYPAVAPGKTCSLSGSLWDGANCYIGPTSRTTSWNGNFYAYYEGCTVGSNDGANCVIGTAPSGTTALMYQGYYYVSTTKGCPVGSFDGNACYIGKPPSSTTAFPDGNDWYWTARYC